jgi:intein/homing endonuclease
MNVSLPVQTSGAKSTTTTTTVVTGSGTTTTNTTTGTTAGGTTTGGSGGCFEAGTKVLMADGTSKNIEEVNRGEIVKSFNVYTNKFENSMVVKRHKIKLEDDLVLLTFSDGTKLQTTTTHPFYTTNGWVSLRPDYHYNMHEDIADDYFEMMAIGQKFYKVDSENNKINLVELTRIQYRHGVSHNHYVYNLDVTGANTFFADGILGHNARDKNIVQNNGNNFYFL